jgi:hypothetical protein
MVGTDLSGTLAICRAAADGFSGLEGVRAVGDGLGQLLAHDRTLEPSLLMNTQRLLLLWTMTMFPRL